jgi:hypothetical protein
MNQLFNPVNYFEFQAFEALHKRETSRRLQAHAGITPHFLILTFSFLLLTFPIVPGNKKAAEALLRAAAFG